MEKTICVFGDSTAWGAWDLEKGGWVNRLWLHIGKKNLDVELYNLSISGGTTETILDRFESETAIREGDILVFQTGGNDAAYEHAGGNHQIHPDQFRKNLEEIIRKAKRTTNEVVFIGFKNCDEIKTTPVSWCDFHYTNEAIEKYNKIMQAVCKENEVLFLDIFNILDTTDFTDGLHPNANGHEKIFIKVRDFLNTHNLI